MSCITTRHHRDVTVHVYVCACYSSKCSYGTKGSGTFEGDVKKSKPAVGTAGILETVEETRLEMVYHNMGDNTVFTPMYVH